ncbi:hypothetical protein V7127_22700 [Bacillus sp. JJ1773]|uniref:hypothetical protein n=1 Tax=Bacillus sp. JJ1773 TaxID=3122965 RepID=UPI002FFF5BDF
MHPEVKYKIFELKGIINTLSELANHDEHYNYPMLENLESIINELANFKEN